MAASTPKTMSNEKTEFAAQDENGLSCTTDLHETDSLRAACF